MFPFPSRFLARDPKETARQDSNERSNAGSRRGSNQVSPDPENVSKGSSNGGSRRGSQVGSSTEGHGEDNKEGNTRTDIPKITVELVDEADPNSLTPVTRRRPNDYKPKFAQPQEFQRNTLQSSTRKRSSSASSTASSGSDRSVASARTVNSRKELLSDDYYLHNFRHTRTSLNQSVRHR